MALFSPGLLGPPISARPVFGLPVLCPGEQPLLLCFTGPVDQALPRLALAELDAALDEVERGGARLVAVSPGPLAAARDVVARLRLRPSLIVDPEDRLALAFGVTPAPRGGLLAQRRQLTALGLGGRPTVRPEGARAGFALYSDGQVAAALPALPDGGLDWRALLGALG